MRITQGATSTLSVVSLFLSLTALLFCAYVLWLEPNRLKAQTELAKAQTELAREVGKLTEWLDARDRRKATEGYVKP